MVCSRLATPTLKILRHCPGDSVPLGFRGDSLLHVISLPHFLGKVFIQIYSASDTQKKKKKNPVNRRQGYQLSEQWIPIVSQVSRALEYPHGFCQGTQESWVIKS